MPRLEDPWDTWLLVQSAGRPTRVLPYMQGDLDTKSVQTDTPHKTDKNGTHC